MIKETLRVTMLYDFYGAILTERQRRCLELHYLDDWSLAEVAEEFEVSRQAVHDILKRSVQVMEDFEGKLRLVENHALQEKLLNEIVALVKKAVKESNGKSVTLTKIEEKVQKLLP